jgi:hypothetical protein
MASSPQGRVLQPQTLFDLPRLLVEEEFFPLLGSRAERFAPGRVLAFVRLTGIGFQRTTSRAEAWNDQYRQAPDESAAFHGRRE